ncbi:MAG: hypothetical protein ACT4PT_07785 [Methanobacteriota archaeon]
MPPRTPSPSAGVGAGIVFGLYGGDPTVAMIGSMIDAGVGAGWALHLAIAAFIGAVYGEFGQRLSPGPLVWPVLGVAYGVVWWGLGPLLLMPLIMGMPEMVFLVGPVQIGSL